MRLQVRIVAGSLRGRKLHCEVHPELRPTPQMVREALFSILGNAVPNRPFWDVFAGTGALGLEALSRGASEAWFIERDHPLAQGIDGHLRAFGMNKRGHVVRSDVYRWAERCPAPSEPVNVFVSPPFADFQCRPDALAVLISDLEQKLPTGSVLVLQGEKSAEFDKLVSIHPWEIRHYGRNLLAIWVKEEAQVQSAIAKVKEEESQVQTSKVEAPRE